MWRIVCIGPGPLDRVRRVVDRGPLHPDEARAQQFARFLKSTGLYESVTVIRSSATSATVAEGGIEAEPMSPEPLDSEVAAAEAAAQVGF